MKIKVIIGTGRQGRYSDKVAYVIDEKLQSAGFETNIIDVRDYESAHTIRPVEKNSLSDKFRLEIKDADAIFLVVPEYNHGYPGELKILLDRLLTEYEGKKVFLAGVSSGVFGGARALESLLPVLVKFNLKIINPPLYFPNVQKIFNKEGKLTDAQQSDRLDKFINDIKQDK
ncbi:MAG: NAD(P)H-dependent oxidoreductase [bacterium]|nr:NAD(P)H-dependent oxidoreductase [bacterium]